MHTRSTYVLGWGAFLETFRKLEASCVKVTLQLGTKNLYFPNAFLDWQQLAGSEQEEGSKKVFLKIQLWLTGKEVGLAKT